MLRLRRRGSDGSWQRRGYDAADRTGRGGAAAKAWLVRADRRRIDVVVDRTEHVLQVARGVVRGVVGRRKRRVAIDRDEGADRRDEERAGEFAAPRRVAAVVGLLAAPAAPLVAGPAAYEQEQRERRRDEAGDDAERKTRGRDVVPSEVLFRGGLPRRRVAAGAAATTWIFPGGGDGRRTTVSEDFGADRGYFADVGSNSFRPQRWSACSARDQEDDMRRRGGGAEGSSGQPCNAALARAGLPMRSARLRSAGG